MKRRSAFNYFGGKNAHVLQEWILAKLKAARPFHLIDVFGGSGAILLNFHDCQIKTFNDLNSDVVNFFTTLRNRPEELLMALELTPHAREEYEAVENIHHENPVEWARRFFVRCVMSFGGSGAFKTYNSWSYTIRDARYRCSQSTARYLNKIQMLPEVVNEIRKWQIEHHDFRVIIEKYDSPETVFYLDPPYFSPDRNGHIKYKHEMSKQDHKDLITACKKMEGKFLLSGYKNPLYAKAFNGGGYFSDILLDVKTHGAHKNEVVYFNYSLQSELQQEINF